jgi:hypothetical protein
MTSSNTTCPRRDCLIARGIRLSVQYSRRKACNPCPISTSIPNSVGAPDKLAYAITCELLSGKLYQYFVDCVRRRERIMPPETVEQLHGNLELFPPEQFEAEAADVARNSIRQSIEEDLPAVQASLEQHQTPAPAANQNPLDLLAPMIGQAVDTDALTEALGHALARHIVTGALEVPAAIFFNLGAVSTTDMAGVPLVVARAGPATDLDSVIKRFREAWGTSSVAATANAALTRSPRPPG